MKRFSWIQTLIVLAALLSFTTSAYAHVTVWPKETTTGAYEKYSVRVPVEKDINTTKVRLEFPQDVKVSTVQPISGWEYQFDKDAEGRFTAITWTATGDGIKQHEFIEFPFVAKNPKETGMLAWKAFQTYADGSVVEWTGAPESDTPSSVTTIKQGTTESGHGAAQETSTGTSDSYGFISLIIAVVALLLSLITLFRKKA